MIDQRAEGARPRPSGAFATNRSAPFGPGRNPAICAVKKVAYGFEPGRHQVLPSKAGLSDSSAKPLLPQRRHVRISIQWSVISVPSTDYRISEIGRQTAASLAAWPGLARAAQGHRRRGSVSAPRPSRQPQRRSGGTLPEFRQGFLGVRESCREARTARGWKLPTRGCSIRKPCQIRFHPSECST
jgi:hypothetical protein